MRNLKVRANQQKTTHLNHPSRYRTSNRLNNDGPQLLHYNFYILHFTFNALVFNVKCKIINAKFKS